MLLPRVFKFEEWNLVQPRMQVRIKEKNGAKFHSNSYVSRVTNFLFLSLEPIIAIAKILMLYRFNLEFLKSFNFLTSLFSPAY